MTLLSQSSAMSTVVKTFFVICLVLTLPMVYSQAKEGLLREWQIEGEMLPIDSLNGYLWVLRVEQDYNATDSSQFTIMGIFETYYKLGEGIQDNVDDIPILNIDSLSIRENDEHAETHLELYHYKGTYEKCIAGTYATNIIVEKMCGPRFIFRQTYSPPNKQNINVGYQAVLVDRRTGIELFRKEFNHILHAIGKGGYAVWTTDKHYPYAPFGPTTTISYRVNSPTNVLLTIHDSLHQVIDTLTDEFQNPGHYHALWEAYDLPSGVYYYTIRIDDSMFVKKTLLMK